MSNKITNTNYDLIVIGAGSGGVRAARIAANYGAKVAIVESVRVGGTCVLRGCVPKKLLVYGSHFASEIEDSKGFGWDISSFKHDWSKLINNKNNELDRLNKIYLNLLSKVTIINGFAKITGNNQVEVNGQVLSAKSILIAVGGKSYMPDIDGKELCINSDEALDLEMLPKSIVINGGGHDMAAGFSVRKNRIEELQIFMDERFMSEFNGIVPQVTHSVASVPLF